MLSQMGSAIDYYFKKGVEGQRDMIDNFQQLLLFRDLATLTNDQTLDNNIVRLLKAKINTIGAAEPQIGRFLMEHFLDEVEE
jgi:hypothetical protein